MGLLYPAKQKYLIGPWNIGAKELLELEPVINSIKESLKNSKSKELISLIKDENDFSNASQKLEDPIVEIKIFDKQRKSLVDNSITEILKDPVLDNFKPDKIHVNIQYEKSNSVDIVICKENEANESGYYEIECFDQKELVNISHQLNNWCDKNKPTNIKLYWNKFSSVIAFFSVIATLVFWSDLYEENLPTTKQLYESNIIKIIESGVDDTNRNEAIELILKMSIDYVPEDTETVKIYNGYYLRFIIYSVVLAIIGIIKPRTVIGIGKNKVWYKFYNWYTKFVIFGLGSILVIDPLLNVIKLYL